MAGSLRIFRLSAAPAILLLAAATAPWRAAGQQPAPGTGAGPGPAAPEPSARIVRVDAVVYDAKGRPVLDLKPADFEIVENGVAQKLDAAELRVVGHAAAAASSAAEIASADDEREAAREPGTRLFALVLDEFHVSAGEPTERVRAAVGHFVDQLAPSDLLVVFKPLDSLTEIRFTRDRTRAREAIAAFSGRQGDYSPRTEFEEKYIGRAPALVRAARVQIILSALRTLTMKLGDLDAGRSAVVLVSEGFAREVGRTRELRLPDVRGIVRAASRHNVAIYTLDPGSTPTQTTDTADAAGDPSEAILRTLASETGGESFLDPRALGAGLQQVGRDLDAYYMLSYTSTHADDGRFYDVQVRTKRREVNVRARSGYWAPLRSELRTSIDAPARPMRALRSSPLIQTWLGLNVLQDGTNQVTFTWQPARLRPGARQTIPPSVVNLKVTTAAGGILFEGEIRSAGDSTGAAAYPDAAVFAASAGRIQADLLVLSADGSRIDTAAHDLDVPDVSKTDPLILPPQVFEAHSARGFRELSARADAAPVPAREFRRTERLLVRVPVYSPSGAAVELVGRLVNRWGQVLRRLEPMERASQGVTQFDLPLGWLAPGDYVIEFDATTAKGSAREVVRIRLTG